MIFGSALTFLIFLDSVAYGGHFKSQTRSNLCLHLADD
jgi:hypothetical protein